MYKILVLLVVLAFVAACSPSVEEKQQQPSKVDLSRKEVMVVHDEAMLLIDDIRNLQASINDTTSESMYIKNELQKADDAMMSWMHDFKVNDAWDEQTKLDYFATEKIKIANVKTMMENSIKLANRNHDE